MPPTGSIAPHPRAFAHRRSATLVMAVAALTMFWFKLK
ncbi:MAG: hypothetical protein QOH39_3694 [Verrucomicrobiota bacterium]